LLRVGLVTPVAAIRLRGSLMGAMLAWTALIAMSANLTQSLILTPSWYNTQAFSTATLKKTASFTPDRWQSSSTNRGSSTFEYRVEFNIDVVLKSGASESGTIDVSILIDDATKAWASLDIAKGGWELVVGNGDPVHQDYDFDSKAALKLYAAAGLDVKRPALIREANQVAYLVGIALTGPEKLEDATTSRPTAGKTTDTGGLTWRSGGTTYPTRVAPRFSVPPQFLVLWGVAAGTYIIGIPLIVCRRARAVSTSHSSRTPTSTNPSASLPSTSEPLNPPPSPHPAPSSPPAA
jgi:hypothetical protein